MQKKILALVTVLVLVTGVAMAGAYVDQTASSKSTKSDELRVNLNTASAEELTELPGIGVKVAARIVTYRDENGRFQKAEEIMNVKGIGEKMFTRLQPHIFVDGKSKKTKR